MTRAGTSSNSTGVALRAVVRLVAGNCHLDQSARRNREFEAATAAVNQSPSRNDKTALLLDHTDCFACGAACGPNVFDHEHAFSRFNFETSTQRHLSGAIALDEKRTHAKGASNLITDDDAPERRGHDARDRKFTETLGKRMTELFGVLRVLENQGALNVCAAVSPARKLKMPGADRSDLFEKLENVVTLHSLPPPWMCQSLSPSFVALA